MAAIPDLIHTIKSEPKKSPVKYPKVYKKPITQKSSPKRTPTHSICEKKKRTASEITYK